VAQADPHPLELTSPAPARWNLDGQMVVSAGCRRQMLYYLRNDDQERCHADRGEAGAA
jgi:hypothetical protein